jgi:transglutaminase superfamily protein
MYLHGLMLVITRYVSCLAMAASVAFAQDLDTDGDGLTDFQEQHKYGTDPRKMDSDGDGVPDGDWLERREYTYTVRSVVHVMKPVTPEYLNDDYQDCRVLDEAGEYYELEVIHYPFNTVASTIKGNPNWQQEASHMKEWLEPGPTSDWSVSMRKELLAALRKDGIDIDKLDDKQVVEQVSKWLLDRAEYHDGFSTFITAFDPKGRPYVPEELQAAVKKGQKDTGLTLEEQWKREISSRWMLQTRSRGSCTSSAIYLTGCLRAIGIPTRIVLCVPLVDGSDEHEVEMVAKGLTHNEVRPIVESALTTMWTSHTFNEVWVGGRWRRLNYSKLGQNTLDGSCLGLMTHIATFRDWADARMPNTVGRRQILELRNNVFGSANPYSTISLRDTFGRHSRLENPAAKPSAPKPSTPSTLKITRLFWTDSPELPQNIQEGCREKGRFGLIAYAEVERALFKQFLTDADAHVLLEPETQDLPLKVRVDHGCWWFQERAAWVYLPFGPADRRDLKPGVPYRVRAENHTDHSRWDVDLRVTRQ